MHTNYKNNLNTKIKLANSLKEILKHKPLSKITINEITSNINVNRNTFYYHFEDINGLIKWIIDNNSKDIISKIDITNHIQSFSLILDYIEENHEFLQKLGGNELKNLFHNHIYKTMQHLINTNINITLTEEYKDFLCNFLTNAIGSNLSAICLVNKSYSKNKIIKYYSYTIKLMTDKLTEKKE